MLNFVVSRTFQPQALFKASAMGGDCPKHSPPFEGRPSGRLSFLAVVHDAAIFGFRNAVGTSGKLFKAIAVDDDHL